MKNRSPWWLCVLALSLVPFSAEADQRGDDDGVPFRLLQQQLDALTQRVGALEAARQTTGQSCQAGQFVAAISATGVITCAAPATAGGAGGAGGTTAGGTTTGGTTAGGGTGAGGANGTTPPPPVVSDAFRAAVQQAFSALSANNVPLAPTPLVIPFTSVIPTSYDLAVGTVVLAIDAPSATATITVAIPTFVWRADASNSLLGAGVLTVTASPATTATIQAAVETTPTGTHRIGTVMSIAVTNAAVTATGAGGLSTALQNMVPFPTILVDEYSSILGGIVPAALATLPEF